ncbi:MAG TPA: DUF3165 family protein [Candidatus Baltobacteraceae bacterium]|jgi:sulfite exporter TauE/SafE|nr:DUF3165 family protein [Candidatus Baltobacteraceae bacterium]
MLTVRTVMAVGMVVAGAVLLVRMVPNALQNPSGIVLGIAMIALGLYRLKQLRTARSAR